MELGRDILVPLPLNQGGLSGRRRRGGKKAEKGEKSQRKRTGGRESLSMEDQSPPGRED